MFATLPPLGNAPDAWRWWFPAALAYILATAALVGHIARNVTVADFPAELTGFAKQFVERTRTHDMRLVAANLAVMAAATALVFLTPNSPALRIVVTLFGLLLSGLGAALLYQDVQLFEQG